MLRIALLFFASISFTASATTCEAVLAQHGVTVEGLRRAIAATPKDNTPRLLLADLLHEVGTSEAIAQEEFIRSAIALSNPKTKGRRKLRATYEKHRPAMEARVAAVAPVGVAWHWDRGFVSQVEVDLNSLDVAPNWIDQFLQFLTLEAFAAEKITFRMGGAPVLLAEIPSLTLALFRYLRDHPCWGVAHALREQFFQDARVRAYWGGPFGDLLNSLRAEIPTFATLDVGNKAFLEILAENRSPLKSNSLALELIDIFPRPGETMVLADLLNIPEIPARYARDAEFRSFLLGWIAQDRDLEFDSWEMLQERGGSEDLRQMHLDFVFAHIRHTVGSERLKSWVFVADIMDTLGLVAWSDALAGAPPGTGIAAVPHREKVFSLRADPFAKGIEALEAGLGSIPAESLPLLAPHARAVSAFLERHKNWEQVKAPHLHLLTWMAGKVTPTSFGSALESTACELPIIQKLIPQLAETAVQAMAQEEDNLLLGTAENRARVKEPQSFASQVAFAILRKTALDSRHPKRADTLDALCRLVRAPKAQAKAIEILRELRANPAWRGLSSVLQKRINSALSTGPTP